MRCIARAASTSGLAAGLPRSKARTRATGVALASGERIAADIVLVATGARANDDLARAAGLRCEDGILVDDFARAAPGIYAIGDCARFSSHRYGRKIRLECVQNAIDQAKAAAAAILGKPKPYDPVPWFWSDQYEIKLQITGLLDGFDAAETVGDPAEGKILGRVPQGRQADRGRCDQRRPRSHAGTATHRSRLAGGRRGLTALPRDQSGEACLSPPSFIVAP